MEEQTTENNNNASYTAEQIAYVLAYISGFKASHLRLQKLLYFVCMAYVGNKKDEGVLDVEFEAWGYGPVSRALFTFVTSNMPSAAKGKHDSVRESVFANVILPPKKDNKGKELWKICDEVCRVFSGIDVWRLVAITHLPGSAWEKRYNKDAKNSIKIEPNDMYEEYQHLHGN